MDGRLVRLIRGRVLVDTRDLAPELGVTNAALISTLTKYPDDFGFLRFQIEKIRRGRPRRFVLLSEEQAILLLTYSKNTKRVRECKQKLVEEFFRMRQALQMRQDGKQSRRIATDATRRLVEHAKSQGSQNAERYYYAITRMVYRELMGVSTVPENFRDNLAASQLGLLAIAECKLAQLVDTALASTPEIPYKELYSKLKACVAELAALAGEVS